MTLTSSEVKLVVVVVVVAGAWIARGVLMNPGVPVGVMCVGVDMCVGL